MQHLIAVIWKESLIQIGRNTTEIVPNKKLYNNLEFFFVNNAIFSGSLTDNELE